MILRILIGGFTLSETTAGALEALKVNRMLFRCGFDMQHGGMDFAAEYLSDRRTPNLLVIEVTGSRQEIFRGLEQLANVCDPETQVILIGEHNDIEFYRDLLSQGVSDYLISPVTPEKLRDSIAKIYTGTNGDYDGRVIAFMGTEGGVGSSVIAHNVAAQLAEDYGERVAVIDFDICFGTAALDFNQQPRQTIVDALNQVGRLDDNLLDQFFMRIDDNLLVLASPASLTLGVQIRSETFDALMRAVRPMAAFVVLDLPHHWEPWITDALADAEEVVLVAKPELANLRDCKNMMEFLGPKRSGDAKTRLALNQIGASKKVELAASDFKDAVALSPAVEIAYDQEAFGKAMNSGELLIKSAPKSKAAQAIRELAELVGGRVVVESKPKASFWPFGGKKASGESESADD